MIASKFFKWVKTGDKYAIFNTLVMDVLYVDRTELEQIVNGNFYKLDIDILKQAGILVESYDKDERALECLKAQYESNSKKIAIMYLILSSGCNLGCKYCFIENNEHNNFCESNMSLEVLDVAVKKYIEYIKTEKIEKPLILFYGGEPTLNFEAIKETIRIVKESNVYVDYSIVTNGTLLSEQNIKFFVDNNIEIGISIDGPKNINDFNRVFRNSAESVYDTVCNNIDLLKKHNARFGLSMTISDYFLEHQKEIFEWVKKMGVNNIFYNLFHFTYNESKNIWEKYYNGACEFLINSHKVLSIYNIHDGRINRKIESLGEKKFKFGDCAAIGANQITVKPNGDVCVCHAHLKTDEFVLGNIVNMDMETVINSDEFDFWVHRTPIYNPKCLSCESLFLCGGGCPTQSEALFGSRDALDIPFCIHTKKTLEWLLKEGHKSTYN